MAKADKKLKVTTPQTIDGNNLEYDENNQVKTRSNLVPLGAKKMYESMNAKLPTHLKHTLEEVDVDDKGREIVKKAPAKKEETK